MNGAPRGSHERQSDEVKQRIERLARLQIGPLQDREKQIAQPTEDLRDELVLDLSPLDSLTGFAKEKELLHQIEKLDWGNTDANKYIANVINNSPRATREGVRVAKRRVVSGRGHTAFAPRVWTLLSSSICRIHAGQPVSRFARNSPSDDPRPRRKKIRRDRFARSLDREVLDVSDSFREINSYYRVEGSGESCDEWHSR